MTRAERLNQATENLLRAMILLNEAKELAKEGGSVRSWDAIEKALNACSRAGAKLDDAKGAG